MDNIEQEPKPSKKEQRLNKLSKALQKNIARRKQVVKKDKDSR